MATPLQGRAVDDEEELAGPAVDDGVAEGVVGPAVGLGPVGSKYEALHARQQFRTVPLATSQIGFNTAHWTSLQFFLPDVLLVFPTRQIGHISLYHARSPRGGIAQQRAPASHAAVSSFSTGDGNPIP